MAKAISKRKRCTVCGKKIITMIYKGSGVCGEQCRKIRDNDTEPFYPGRVSDTGVRRDLKLGSSTDARITATAPTGRVRGGVDPQSNAARLAASRRGQRHS